MGSRSLTTFIAATAVSLHIVSSAMAWQSSDDVFVPPAPEDAWQLTPVSFEPNGSELIVSADFVPFQQETSVLPTGWIAPEQLTTCCQDGWQLLPNGLLYTPYYAGEKEPRFAAQWLWEKDRGLIWETSLGGRFGLIRNGTVGPNGEGFQFDVEGAGQARIDPEQDSDLEAADFRAGFVGTWRKGCWRTKAGYYHISSHVGDEFLIDNPGFRRRNYVRDALLIGVMYDVLPDVQLYGEYAAALNHNGGAEVGEIQLGAQYLIPGPTGKRGAPFAAINGHLREEFNYGGSVNIVAGWMWRGAQTGKVFRIGGMVYDGPSIQYSFFDRHESLTGLGIWLDF